MYSRGQRIIFLADLDCFFVEVERLHRPELCGRAVVIGGRPGERGVVAACSYEARALGIHSAMPMGEAYRRAGVPYGREQGTGNREQERGTREGVRGQDSGFRGSGESSHIAHRTSHSGLRTPDFGPRTSDYGVVFLHEGLFGNYERYSHRVQDILRCEAPVFHARSIDEFELDVSGCERLFAQRYGGIIEFAEYLRRRVREEVGLALSIGIGPSRIVAKMASRHAKPDKKVGGRPSLAASSVGRAAVPAIDESRTEPSAPLQSPAGTRALPAGQRGSGVFRVLPEEVLAFLAPHDVQAVPGIGPATGAKLREMGINRVGQLLAQPPNLLRHAFGIGMLGLVEALHGDEEAGNREQGTGTREEGVGAAPMRGPSSAAGAADGRPMGAAPTPDFGLRTAPASVGIYAAAPSRRPKSIGHEMTFARDVIDPAVWERTLWRLTEDACRRLRSADLRARQITLKIRYSDFGTLTHGGPLSEPSDVDSVIFQRVRELFAEGNTRRLRIRLLGVRLEKLCAGASQGLLFETRRLRREHDFFTAVDRIRDKHGDDAVLVGPGVAKLKEGRPLSAMSTAGIQTGFMHGRN